MVSKAFAKACYRMELRSGACSQRSVAVDRLCTWVGIAAESLPTGFYTRVIPFVDDSGCAVRVRTEPT